MSQSVEPHLLLEWARELGKAHLFMDFHIHPFEVQSGDMAYLRNEQVEGLFSKPGSAYHPPVLEPDSDSTVVSPFVDLASARALLLASRLKYAHTGSKVIADQLKAAALSGALLLPVARSAGAAQEMLEASARMFSHVDRLYIGCALPVGVPAEKLAEFFYTAHAQYGIRAIKIHPNLAGVNPITPTGHNQIEASLEAAGKLGLPIVVHTGRTSVLKPSDEAEYGMLQRLETINWGLSASPVILAHAGCHDLAEDEARLALSKLDSLFQKYPNLMADTSNLEPALLRLVLKRVNRSRLLFGSDALYVPVWKAWLRFLRVLRHVSPSPDDDLIRMASLNPAHCLGIIKVM